MNMRLGWRRMILGAGVALVGAALYVGVNEILGGVVFAVGLFVMPFLSNR